MPFGFLLASKVLVDADDKLLNTQLNDRLREGWTSKIKYGFKKKRTHFGSTSTRLVSNFIMVKLLPKAFPMTYKKKNKQTFLRKLR